MKTALPYFLLLVCIVLLFSLWRSNRELQKILLANNSQMQQHIEAKQAEILKSDTIIATIREKMRKDSLRDMPIITGLKLQARTLRIKLAELGGITQQEVADTTCARLIQVSQLKDSVIEKQDSLIRTLEERHIGQILDLQALIKEKTSQIMAQIAIGEVKDQAYTNLETDLKKAKRKSTFKSIGLGILTGGIIYMSLKE